jgi:hypothetical protein
VHGQCAGYFQPELLNYRNLFFLEILPNIGKIQKISTRLHHLTILPTDITDITGTQPLVKIESRTLMELASMSVQRVLHQLRLRLNERKGNRMAAISLPTTIEAPYISQ